MSEQKIFIAGYIPDEKSVEESGARSVATSFMAKDLKHAQAKASLLFIEEYPGAQDAAYKILVCEDAVGIPRPPRGTWCEDFFEENIWDEERGHPIKRGQTEPQPVNFDSLSKLMKIAVLVKHERTDITTDMLPAALALTQEDQGEFEGHIVDAIEKSPDIANMHPERMLFAIGWVKHKCAKTKKWPEIKAELHVWKKRQEAERKETGVSKSVVDIARERASQNSGEQSNPAPDLKSGSGNPDRFDLVVAMLVMGVNPVAANATDVKNAKHIKETRDPAWREWRTTLVGIPGIYLFPESELYNLTLKGMKNLQLIQDAAARRAYVREHFAGHVLLPDYLPEPEGIAYEKTEQEPQNAAGILADAQAASGSVDTKHPGSESEEAPDEVVTERQGPFYYRTAAGDKIGRANKLPKLQEVLAQGCVEITQEEYQTRKTGTYNGTENSEQVTNVEQSLETAAPAPSNEVEKQENLAKAEPDTASPVVDFQSVGASLEKDLQEKPDHAQDNLKIWRSVMRTDPRFTKQMTGMGFEGTSINAEYMIMRATEIFGPIGSRWGFEILEDRMIPGAPFSEPVYEDKKFIGNRMLRDGDGTLIFEQNHSMKIRFWYQTETDEGSVHAYGATPYMFKTKHGIKCDGEAQKKSLTDALKKALSLLGFSADVWLGLYDLPEYQAENSTEFAIKNASDKAEDVTRLRNELDEKLTRVANTIENAVSTNEAKKVFDTLAREVEVHRKAAEAKGDSEHAKYLSGRLRRLNQIKEQRIQALTDAEASNA